MQRDLDETFPFVTLSEFASWTHFANWLDISASKSNYATLKPILIDKEFLRSRMGFTRVYQLVQDAASESTDLLRCFDVLLRLNAVAQSSQSNERRAALFLSRNLFMALQGRLLNEAAHTKQCHERWRVVCTQCVEQWHGILRETEGDEVHTYLQPAVLALINNHVALKSSALIAGAAELMCTLFHCRARDFGDEALARTHRALLVQLLQDKPHTSAVLVAFFDRVRQFHIAWALHLLQHIVVAIKTCDRAARKNRKDSATHLVTFIKECCERDRRAVTLFADDLLAMYTTAASPTRRALADVLLALEHDWSLVLTLLRDSDVHIRARAVAAAVTFDATLTDRLRVVSTSLSDDSKMVQLQAVKSLQRLHNTRDRNDEDYSALFYESAMPELYRILNTHPASEKWSKDTVRAIEQLLCSDVMVELHHLLPCFGFDDEILGCSVARVISRALRLPGESAFALYAAVSLSLLAARLNANELELFEHMIACMLQQHDQSARELVSTLFAVFFEPTRHLHMFGEVLQQQDVRRHTVHQSQSSALRLGSIIVLAQLSHTCDTTQGIAPLVQYLEEFALQAQSRTLNESQFDYFQRINNFALQVLAQSAIRTPNKAIEEFCEDYLLALIKLGNVRTSVRLLYSSCNSPLERGAKLLRAYEESLLSCESFPATQTCRFTELIGEIIAQSHNYIASTNESATQEQDCRDELTRRHVIDERVAQTVEGLTRSGEFFARYVPLVEECLVCGPAVVRRTALLSLGRLMASSLELTQHYLPLLDEMHAKGEWVEELLVIYGDLLVQYPRDTAPLLTALLHCLEPSHPLGVQCTAMRVVSALAIHRLIKCELVLPSVARQLLHAEKPVAALALSFFAQLAARESSSYTRHLLLIYNELHHLPARVAIIRTLLQFCREAQRTELVELWSRELSAERVQLLNELLPSARSLAHLQHARTTQATLYATLEPHLLLGRQRGSVAVKTTCSTLLQELRAKASFEE